MRKKPSSKLCVTMVYVAVRHDDSLTSDDVVTRIRDAMHTTDLEWATALVPPDDDVEPAPRRKRAPRRRAHH